MAFRNPFPIVLGDELEASLARAAQFERDVNGFGVRTGADCSRLGDCERYKAAPEGGCLNYENCPGKEQVRGKSKWLK